MESADSLRSEATALDLSEELRALTAIANSQRVTLYGLSSGAGAALDGGNVVADGRVTPGARISFDLSRARLRQESLRRMADDTGGRAVGPDETADGLLARVLADAGSVYSLGYASPHGGDAKYHRIKVKVARKGVELRHRAGYVDRGRDLRIGDLVAAALLFGEADNPHRLELQVLSQKPVENGRVEVTLELSLPMAELQLAPVDGRRETKLELYVQSRDATGAMTPLKIVDLAVVVPEDQLAIAKGKLWGAHLPLLLTTGPQSIAVGLVEPGAQRTSVARTRIDVAARSRERS
jgi:hypothetical protein